MRLRIAREMCVVRLLRSRVIFCCVSCYFFLVVTPNVAYVFYHRAHADGGGYRLPDHGFELLPEMDAGRFHDMPLVVLLVLVLAIPIYGVYLSECAGIASTPASSPPTNSITHLIRGSSRITYYSVASPKFIRVVSVFCLVQWLRVGCYLTTPLPGSGQHCLGQLPSPPSWLEVWTSPRRAEHKCGDLMFSGHMATALLACLTADK